MDERTVRWDKLDIVDVLGVLCCGAGLHFDRLILQVYTPVCYRKGGARFTFKTNVRVRLPRYVVLATMFVSSFREYKKLHCRKFPEYA